MELFLLFVFYLMGLFWLTNFEQKKLPKRKPKIFNLLLGKMPYTMLLISSGFLYNLLKNYGNFTAFLAVLILIFIVFSLLFFGIRLSNSRKKFEIIEKIIGIALLFGILILFSELS